MGDGGVAFLGIILELGHDGDSVPAQDEQMIDSFCTTFCTCANVSNYSI
jgi:hypothetical protein